MVPSLSPLRHRFSMEDEDMEEGVEQEDDVWFDRHRVEEDWMGLLVERVGHQGRLDHDQRVVDIFSIEDMSRFIPNSHNEISPNLSKKKKGGLTCSTRSRPDCC